MRLRTLLVLATVCSLAASWLLWRDLLGDGPSGAKAVPPTTRERQLGFLLTPSMSAVLERRLPSPCVLDSRLDGAFEILREIAGLKEVDVPWPLLERAGIARDKRISLDVSGLPFADALVRLMMHIHSPALDLVFRVEGDGTSVNNRRMNYAPAVPPWKLTIKIMPDRVYRPYWPVTEFCAYDVRELLSPLLAPQLATDSTRLADPGPLIRQIEATVDPGSWSPSDSVSETHSNSIVYDSGHLVVTQTSINQADIAVLIEDLLRARRLRAFGLRSVLLSVVVLAVVTFADLVVGSFLARRRGLRVGVCRVCGYDVRATPVRCPECGASAEREEAVTS